jgi:hypothetical protein
MCFGKMKVMGSKIVFLNTHSSFLFFPDRSLVMLYSSSRISETGYFSARVVTRWEVAT